MVRTPHFEPCFLLPSRIPCDPNDWDQRKYPHSCYHSIASNNALLECSRPSGWDQIARKWLRIGESILSKLSYSRFEPGDPRLNLILPIVYEKMRRADKLCLTGFNQPGIALLIECQCLVGSGLRGDTIMTLLKFSKSNSSPLKRCLKTCLSFGIVLGGLTFGAVSLGATDIARADSCWNHNGSLMRLKARGNQRWFYYERPRAGLAVRPRYVAFQWSQTRQLVCGHGSGLFKILPGQSSSLSRGRPSGLQPDQSDCLWYARSPIVAVSQQDATRKTGWSLPIATAADQH